MQTTSPADVLAALGGTATYAELLAWCTRTAVRSAVADGSVERLRRGTYGLPECPDPRRTAKRLGAVVSHHSAAQHWDVDLLERPRGAHLTVARHRTKVPTGSWTLHWADLPESDVQDGVTVPLRTVLDCCRTMEFREGLAVADSALRKRLIGQSELLAAAEALRGPGRGRALRVARAADRRVGSVLESALRALLVEARITGFEPQVEMSDGGFFARVDLAHRGRRIVLEADSFEHHGHRKALARDCRRYTELTIRGWRVLRFAWEHVMFEPDWVVEMIRAALASHS